MAFEIISKEGGYLPKQKACTKAGRKQFQQTGAKKLKNVLPQVKSKRRLQKNSASAERQSGSISRVKAMIHRRGMGSIINIIALYFPGSYIFILRIKYVV